MILLDTNILARMVDPNSPHHKPSLDAAAILHAQGNSLSVCAQNLVEFYAIACRPTNGLGMTSSTALAEIEGIKNRFNLLPEVPLQSTWEMLIGKYQVIGKVVFDLRLVAAALAGGCGEILTFNDADFSRFTEIKAVNPFDLLGIPRV